MSRVKFYARFPKVTSLSEISSGSNLLRKLRRLLPETKMMKHYSIVRYRNEFVTL